MHRIGSPASRAWCAAVLCLSGCATPWNTRFPTLFPRSVEYEQREAEIQDPYPDADLGPDTGVRPTDYSEQRSEERRAKDRHQSSILRQQFGQPTSDAGPGAAYPDAVRQ
jgi:hypothetical protein